MAAAFALAGSAAAQLVPIPGINLERGVQPRLSGIGAGAASPERLVDELPTSTRVLFHGWDRWWALHAFSAAWLPPATGSSPLIPDDLRSECLNRLRRGLAAQGLEERRAAAQALARFGGAGTLSDLLDALEEADDATAESLMLAIASLGRSDTRSLFRAIARDERRGRRALGQPLRPVPTELRAAAMVALGIVGDDAELELLADIATQPASWTEDLALAAALGLAIPRRNGELGEPPRRSLTIERVDGLLAVLADPRASNDRRSTVLVALAVQAKDLESVRSTILGSLEAVEPCLMRGAAAAAAHLEPDREPRLLPALRRGAAAITDDAAAGLAMLALATVGEAEDLERLSNFESLPPSRQAYAALGLAILARRIEGGRKSAIEALQRRLVQAGDRTAERAPFVEALGLLAVPDSGDGDAAVELAEGGDATRLAGLAHRAAIGAGPERVQTLLEVVDDRAAAPLTRAFALGSLGLIFEQRPISAPEMLRLAVALPLDSTVLMRLTSHL